MRHGTLFLLHMRLNLTIMGVFNNFFAYEDLV